MSSAFAFAIGCAAQGYEIPNINNATAQGFGFSSQVPTIASYRLNGNGTIVLSGGSQPPWLSNPLNVGLYEVRATLVSGPISGILNTWQSLATSRAWSISRGTIGTGTASMTLQIRLASSGQVLDTATISFSVEVEP